MLQPGDAIDAWIVEEHLGQGGMGSVYRCRNKLIDGIDAAVKVLRPTGGVLQERERFFREVKALHRLRHPAIVRVSGWGEDVDRGLLWMAMDLVEGEDLSQRMARGPLAPDVGARWLRRLAEALAHAHAQGTFHRDLKPANVVVGSDGEPVLVDFGISVQQGETRLTQTGMFVGTPSYMPPEVFGGERTSDAVAEVYALGQLIFEALVGREAFPGDPSDSTARRIVALMAAKVRADELDPGPGVPEPLRGVVRRMTAVEPEDRLPSMTAVLRELAAAPPVAPPKPDPTRWVRNEPSTDSAPPVTPSPAASPEPEPVVEAAPEAAPAPASDVPTPAPE